MSCTATETDRFDQDFNRIYERYYNQVRRFLGRFFHCPLTRDDMAQDVFLKIYGRRIELDPEHPSTVNYLFTVAKNHAIDHIRRQQTEARGISNLIAEARMDVEFYRKLEDIHIEGCVLSAVHETIDGLPDDMQAVYLDKTFHKKTSSSISRQRKMSRYQIRKIQKMVECRIRKNVAPLLDER